MNWTISVAIGIGSSAVASLIFFLALAKVRPRLKIAPHISRLPRDEPVGVLGYRFKVVNLSRRAIVEVKYQAFVDRPMKIPESDGNLRRLTPVPLIQTADVIPGRDKSKDARYARRVRVDGDLLAYWPEDEVSLLLLRVTGRDVFSGAFGTFEHQFRLHREIRDGTFASGLGLDILPVHDAAPRSPVPMTKPEPEVPLEDDPKESRQLESEGGP